MQVVFRPTGNKKMTCVCKSFFLWMRMTGLEPARAQCPLEPESSASANSATSAYVFLNLLDYHTIKQVLCQQLFSNFLQSLFIKSFLSDFICQKSFLPMPPDGFSPCVPLLRAVPEKISSAFHRPDFCTSPGHKPAFPFPAGMSFHQHYG